MVMKVQTFLSGLKQTIDASNTSKPLKFVSGNQSADLDSVILAISFSFFASLKQQSYIPLINIPRADLRLRRDIVLVLQAHNISDDLLYFIEDLNRLTNGRNDTEFVLVDHCNLQGPEIIDLYHQNRLKVTGIIDHHADENFAVDALPRIVHSNGSCSSLVFNYWYDTLGKDISFYKSTDVTLLLLAPLLIDTGNMTLKVEEADTVAWKRYSEILLGSETVFATIGGAANVQGSGNQDSGVSNPFESYFKAIKTQKKNVTGFSVLDLLRKDYKQFEFTPKSGKPVNVGFSSLGKAFLWIQKTYPQSQILTETEELRKSKGLDLLVMTPLYNRKDTLEYVREFCMLISKSSPNVEYYKNQLPNAVPSLQLDSNVYLVASNSIDDNQLYMVVYNQKNLAASRKQIVPAVKDALEGATLA